MSGPSSPVDVAAPPSVAGIFTSFVGVGLMGFGGVLPLARRMIVEDRRWMAPADFNDLLALCQFLPGGNVINLSVAVGMRFGGLPGALAGIVGLMAAPIVVVIALGAIYLRYQDQPAIRRLFAGLAAAAAGLVVATAVKIAIPLRSRPQGAAMAALCFVAIALLRLPLLPTMLVMVPLSVLIASRSIR